MLKIISKKEYNKLKEIERKQLRDLLLQYEVQNTKLQEELVRLRVNAGKSVY